MANYAEPAVAENYVPRLTPGMGALPLCWGNLSFDDVFVPAENLVGDEGHGYSVAMDHTDFSRPALGLLCLGGLRPASTRR